MPRAPLALPAITGQKDPVRAWRDETSAAASGPKSCPPLAAPHRATQRKDCQSSDREWWVRTGWRRPFGRLIAPCL